MAKATKANGKKRRKATINRSLIIKLSVFVFLCVVAIGVVVGISTHNQYKEMKSVLDRDTIYNNIYIDAVNVGGMTKEQAKAALEEQVLGRLLNKTVTLVDSDGERYPLTYSQFGVTLDLEKQVNAAYEYGRSGSIRKRYNTVMALENQAKHINDTPETETPYSYDSNKITEAVKALEDKVYVAPTNATMVKENGKFVTKSGKIGYKLNVEATAKAVEDMVKFKNEGEDNVDVFISKETIQPEYKEDAFDNSKDVVGEASTKYSGGDSARITNMKVAAGKINTTVIYPNEVFSTNKCFGEMTAKNGYQPAPTIVSGKLVDDYGGGVCQVSSTLYNAVLYSELEVVERQNHSLKVGYEDYGFDATLAGDYIDFKFKNSTDKPIYLEAYLTGSKVICRIYGHETRSKDRTIKFENSLVETIEPGADKITYDDTLDEGVKETTVKALKGYKYKVYKFVYEKGQLVEKVLVNNSYYKPRAAEITVGTKKPETAEASTEETTAAATTTTPSA